MLTQVQRFAIERKAGVKLARQAIAQCQWRLVRPKPEDPVGCGKCGYFLAKTCDFRKFLDARGDKKAWVAE